MQEAASTAGHAVLAVIPTGGTSKTKTVFFRKVFSSLHVLRKAKNSLRQDTCNESISSTYLH